MPTASLAATLLGLVALLLAMCQPMLGVFVDPTIGQQVPYLFFSRSLGQSREHVAQVGERIDPQSFAGGHQGVQHRGGFSSSFAAYEQPIQPTYHLLSQRVLGPIVIDGNVAIGGVQAQRLPVIKRVLDRLSQSALRECPLLSLEPLLEFIQDRNRLPLA